MTEKKEFYCLRCEHHFVAEHEARRTVERTCPNCGSNSVRLVPVLRAHDKGKPQSVERR